MDTFMTYLENPNSANSTFHNITASLLLSRINACIKGYETTLRSLAIYGFSLEELTKIDNFAAWDLAQGGHVSKLAAAEGFVDKTTAWEYMLTAGENAYRSYTSWRQFLGAYFIGWGMMDNKVNIADFRDTIQYLLKNPKSPYHKLPLKSS